MILEMNNLDQGGKCLPTTTDDVHLDEIGLDTLIW